MLLLFTLGCPAPPGPEDTACATSSWYPDADGDGYGTDSHTLERCTAPTGWVGVGGDCDDLDAAVSPDAREVCDLVDNDCNGEVDGRDAAEAEARYRDNDGDGYGRTAVEDGCLDAGYSINGTDCNDGYALQYPGAPELCDGYDNDCDRETDEEGSDGGPWYTDADGDGYGAGAAFAGACDQPEGASWADTDCDDGDASTWPGAPEVCADGVANDCAESGEVCEREGEWPISEIDTSFWGSDYDGGPSGLAFAGDVDGDGVPDLLVGDSDGGYLGIACLWFGPVDGGHVLADGDSCWEAVEYHDGVGWSAAAGDTDGDGEIDPAFGAPGEDSGGIDAGAVYVVWNVLGGTRDADTVAVILTGEEPDDAAGSTLVATDLTGDGMTDLAIGAPGNDAGASGAGAVYVVASEIARGTTNLGAIDRVLVGGASGGDAGSALASGDVDGDGLDDLVVGAPGVNAVYVVYGGFTSGSLADADVTWVGQDAAGTSVATGDLDDDGRADLVVGAPDDDTLGVNAGAVFIASGSGGELVDAIRLAGEDSMDAAGSLVALAGDLDGDGRDDLAVSAPGQDGYDRDGGAVYLVPGPITASTELMDAANATFWVRASSLAAGSDLDADGSDDVLVGTSESVYVLYGGGR